MTEKERIEKILEHFGLTSNALAKVLGLSSTNVIYHVTKGRNGIGRGLEKAIKKVYPEINPIWLATGEGEMLKPKKSLIPLYDDVATIGGTIVQVATVQAVSAPAEYIDTGDWFKEATAAIRHYGDSMVEYPSGCILALQDVQERRLILWGKNYIIETDEYRITKKIQKGKTEEYIKAYSTNTAKHPDGRLIHEPQDIAWVDIRRIFLVLGYVVKENGGTVVLNSR